MKIPLQRFKTSWPLFLLTPLLAWTPQARASIYPSFAQELCTWYATDVVLATEGEAIDGRLQVLEVCKGQLKVGEEIVLPELAVFAPKEARWVGARTAEGRKKPATYVTGSRMWLFLVKSPKAPDPQRWYGANGDMDISVAWAEPEMTYAFMQLRSPIALLPVGTTGAQFGAQVRDMTGQQAGIAQAVSLPDLAQRAKALRPFAISRYDNASSLALTELGKCGSAAVPILRAVLNDEALPGDRFRQVVEALAKAGGSAVGPELTRLLESETKFWKQTAPQLPVGWWKGTGLEWTRADSLRHRYWKTSYVLRGLKETNYQGISKAVKELRDLWRSLPQLNDRDVLNALAEQCDELLKAVENLKPNGN